MSITYRDIARAAGVSPTTVSLALRHHPSIPEKTRAKVREAVEALGYRPNPLVSALMTSLRASRKRSVEAVFAIINYQTPQQMARLHPVVDEVMGGAKLHAHQFGYEIDTLSVDRVETSHRDMQKILQARGITGLLLNDTGNLVPQLDIDWDQFTVVRIGSQASPMQFHTVSTDHFRNMTLAVDTLIERGYQRVGYAYAEWASHVTDGRYEAAYLRMRRVHGAERLVEPFTSHLAEPHTVIEWARRQRLDALITPDSKILREVRACGLRVPEDLAVAHLDVATEGMQGWSGVHQDRHAGITAAVELLISECNHNHRGYPKHPMAIGIAGDWRDGDTVRHATA